MLPDVLSRNGRSAEGSWSLLKVLAGHENSWMYRLAMTHGDLHLLSAPAEKRQHLVIHESWPTRNGLIRSDPWWVSLCMTTAEWSFATSWVQSPRPIMRRPYLLQYVIQNMSLNMIPYVCYRSWHQLIPMVPTMLSNLVPNIIPYLVACLVPCLVT